MINLCTAGSHKTGAARHTHTRTASPSLTSQGSASTTSSDVFFLFFFIIIQRFILLSFRCLLFSSPGQHKWPGAASSERLNTAAPPVTMFSPTPQSYATNDSVYTHSLQTENITSAIQFLPSWRFLWPTTAVTLTQRRRVALAFSLARSSTEPLLDMSDEG